MASKTRNVIGWVLGRLLSAVMLFSATRKFMANEEIAQMNSALD